MSKALVEGQLRRLGIELPPAPKPVGAYVAVTRTGNLVVTSGQLPWKGDKLLYTGKLGMELVVPDSRATTAGQARTSNLGKLRQLP
jgi:enamine deaminase RidA (YjgF/YER057c/UK114 family)